MIFRILTILFFTSSAFGAITKVDKKHISSNDGYYLKKLDPYEVNKVTVRRIAKKVFANIYYVKLAGGTGSGLDSNSNAWSYSKLNATALASGSVVRFRSGETFTGQLQQWPGVTYETYGGNGNAKISGFITLPTWTQLTGNIYYATLSFSQVQVVTLDGVMKGMGRYPNSGYLTYTSHSGNTSITGTTIGTLPNSYIGGEAVIKKFRYIIDRHKITGQSGNTITYTATNFYGNNSNYEPTDGNGYFIQNHVNTLDQEGEWAYDTTTSRLYMHFGSGTPSGRVVKASNTQYLAVENSVSGVIVNNMDFEGGVCGVYHTGSTGTTFNNCNFRLCGTAIYGIDCTNITLNNCTVANIGSNGFFGEANCSSATVYNSTFSNIGLIPGLLESGDGRGSAVSVAGNGFNATNTTVKNAGFNGIAFEGDNVIVYQNYVDSFNLVKDDGAGIYTFTTPTQTRFNRIIRKNIVLHAIGNSEGALANGDANGEAAAIYLDGYANHTTVDSNFCAVGSWAGILENANSDNTITNNKAYDFAYCLALSQTATTGYGALRNLTLTGNTFVARTSSQVAMLVSIVFAADEPGSFGTNINNNIYARPFDDNQTIAINRAYSGGSGYTAMNLTSWKTLSGYDAASNKSSVTTTNLADLSYQINTGTSLLDLTLPYIYKNVQNSSYTGAISLPPYGGEVLIYSGLLPPPAGNQGWLIIRYPNQIKVVTQ